jgi:hypothetical protein
VERWDLEQTYRLVEAAFGTAQQRLARESMRSVLDRRAFASYHYIEAVRLTRAFERKYLEGSLLIDLYGQDGDRKRNAFEKYILKAGAHATAAVQSIHAVPDILAHAIYFASGQNLRPEPPEDKDISLPFVARHLKSDPRFQSLAPLLAKAQSGSSWKHVAALSNLSKHRTLVRAALSEDWSGTRKNLRELQFKSCEYHGKPYPTISLQALMEPEHHRLSIAILALGHELNACLHRDAAQAQHKQ